jgi:hypothetical protein
MHFVSSTLVVDSRTSVASARRLCRNELTVEMRFVAKCRQHPKEWFVPNRVITGSMREDEHNGERYAHSG